MMSITTTTMDAKAGVGSASTVVNAPPELVYDVVTDLSRMGEWSPECVGVDLAPGGRVQLGTTFVGRNSRDDNEWTTDCRVLAAEPGREFSFFAGDDETGTTWAFSFERTEGGTRLTESFDSRRLRHPEWVEMLTGRAEQLVGDIEITLAAIKAAVEQGS
jgi:uncharacterized protein YndB with AHSA1/START domain